MLTEEYDPRHNDNRHDGYGVIEINGFEEDSLRIKKITECHDNQIEKAIRDLKRKLSKEGFFSEIKERRFYDKPSVQKKKKQAKAAKRLRKKMRRF